MASNSCFESVSICDPNLTLEQLLKGVLLDESGIERFCECICLGCHGRGRHSMTVSTPKLDDGKSVERVH
jgi:hypothetical protein